jgi:hypothetical protein
MNYLFLMSFFLAGCTAERPKVASEDYVLLEFASKLEEDYHKLKRTK